MTNISSGEYVPRINMRKIVRESNAEKKRMGFVAVRKIGGGNREVLRRRIGGFHQMHHMSDSEVRVVEDTAAMMGVKIRAGA